MLKLLQVLIFKTFLVHAFAGGHFEKNESGVITTYTGHSEAEKLKTFKLQSEKPNTESNNGTQFEITTRYNAPDILFVPNERIYEPAKKEKHEEIREVNSETKNYGIKIEDVLNKKTLNDVVNGKIHVYETESPHPGIFFVSGKNNEDEEEIVNVRKKEKKRKTEKPVTVVHQLDCAHLNCNNSLNAVCGAKLENGHGKYRLFLNECYFRKVNCAFNYEVNRYKIVSTNNCKHIATHFTERPFVFKLRAPPQEEEMRIPYETRKFSSRRSLNIGVDGKICSHLCPIKCPEDYAPECAVSGTGRRKVFLNHCQLDYNSCFYGVVWHKRPLAECVGGKKADMQQNSAFIGWMQKVGIVDKKGRLVLS